MKKIINLYVILPQCEMQESIQPTVITLQQTSPLTNAEDGILESWTLLPAPPWQCQTWLFDTSGLRGIAQHICCLSHLIVLPHSGVANTSLAEGENICKPFQWAKL